MERKILSGWGNYPRVECDIHHPLSRNDVHRLIEKGELIARGLGRSYGDPALNQRGSVADMTKMDRYLGFDPDSALLTCEAGVSLEQIIADFSPRGFFPLVTPGTKFVTVGGCIANDVHGKAHHVDGCFSSSVESFELILASGESKRVSREQDADLFWACFGGMGLLGIITQATLKLRRIETTYFKQRALVVHSLEDMLAAFEEADASYPYSVAWLDPLATGDHLGKGVLTMGDHAAIEDLPKGIENQPLKVSPPPLFNLPVEMPNFALNPLTLRMLNLVIGQVQARGAAIAHYEKFFYPLDAIGEWNKGYGARGFTQYQFVVPLDDGERRLRPILEKIAQSGQLPFLNVLKKLGKEEGMLSFPFDGYTFAIDFPIAEGLPELLKELDAMVLDAQGRIYLGKDAFLGKNQLEKMYPKLGQWRDIKAAVDPDNRFASEQSRRVGLTP